MPLYEYRCGRNHVWDEFRRIHDRGDSVVCPVCGERGQWRYSPPVVSNASNQTLASIGHDLFPSRTPRREEAEA